MPQALHKIPPIKAEIKPPIDPKTGERAQPVGHTADGERIVYLTHVIDFEATKKNRRPVLDQNGEPVYREDRFGGTYQVFHPPQHVYREIKVVPRQHPQGHLRWDPYHEPSEEDKKRAKKKQMVESFSEELAEFAVEHGLTPKALLARVMGSLGGQTASAPPEAAAEASTPKDPGDDDQMRPVIGKIAALIHEAGESLSGANIEDVVGIVEVSDGSWNVAFTHGGQASYLLDEDVGKMTAVQRCGAIRKILRSEIAEEISY